MEKIVRQTADFVRAKLEVLRYQHPRFGMIESFPTGCCSSATRIYLYYLQNHRGIDPELLYFVNFVQKITEVAENDVPDSHCWARVGSFQVDLTGDQFGAEKVIVCKGTPWPNKFSEPSEVPFAGMELDVTYEDNLARICELIAQDSSK